MLKVGNAVQLSQYPNRFANSLIVAIILLGLVGFTVFSKIKPPPNQGP